MGAYVFESQGLVLPLGIFIIVFLFALRLVVSVRPGSTYLDPGIIFVIAVFLSLAPVAAAHTLGFIVTPPYWRITDPPNLVKVIELYTLLLIVFAVVYFFFARKFDLHDDFTPSNIHLSKMWIVIYLILFLIAILGRSISLNVYAYSWIVNLESTCRIIAAGVILSRVSTINQARVAGIFLLLLMLFLIGPTVQEGQYVVNRGGAFLLALGAIAYADRVRWKGRLVSGRWMLLAVPFAMVLLGLANFVEEWLADSTAGVSAFLVHLVTAFEPRIGENASVVVNWVDIGREPLRYGATYFSTIIELVYPFYEHLSASYWFVGEVLGPSYIGQRGFGFSALAEGYLNFGYFGVFFAASFCAGVALLIRYFYHSNRMRLMGPFLYAITLRLGYYLYRTDSEAVLKRMEYAVVEVIILVLIYHAIRAPVKYLS